MPAGAGPQGARAEAMMRAIAAALFALAFGARAEAPDVIRIGVLNDQSGLYSYLGGTGSVLAAQLAVDDFGGKIGNTAIEVLSGDHRNKPDIGSNIAREW